MIWISPIQTPVIGDLKVVTKFEWFPKRIGDKKIWLEKYQQLWEYTERQRNIWSGTHAGQVIMCKDWDLIGEKVMRGLPEMDNPPPPPGSTEKQKQDWKQFISQQKKSRFNS